MRLTMTTTGGVTGNFPGVVGSDSSARRHDNNLVVGGGEEA